MAIGYTQAEADALRAAVVSGVLTVHYAGPPARTVTYQSLAEMKALLKEMVAEIGTAAGTRTTYRVISTKNGFDT